MWATRYRQLSIRNKLLALVLLPLLLVLPLLGLILLAWAGQAFDRLLLSKVRSDLAVAGSYFARVVDEIGATAAAAADSQRLHAALHRGDDAAAVALLQALQAEHGLDFINLIGPDGRLRLSSSGPGPGRGAPGTAARQSRADVDADAEPGAAPGPPAPSRPVGTGGGPPGPADTGANAGANAGAATPEAGLDAAATGDGPALPGALGRRRARLEVVSPAALQAMAPDLASRAEVGLLPTRNAAATDRLREDRALVAVALEPMAAPAGTGPAPGYLQAGVLLNRNLALIDRLNAIVYPPDALPFGSQGTATLFLDDVRIATNVHLFDGDRAIGTRVSQSVRDAVLLRGETWLDRAFVVQDWYVSAYEPLRDGQGRRVGMLYVGFLERPIAAMKTLMLGSLAGVFALVTIAAAWVSLRWAREVFQPLERMAQTLRCIEAGEGEARVGPVASGDEIGRLARLLDHLLDTLHAQTRDLQRWNAELDAKVATRTHELEQAHQQLLRAERLAAIGQLTAGIAHELNNPMAVIQGNLDLMRELLGADGAQVDDELRHVDEQIARVRRTVSQMLRFARPGEAPGERQCVDLAEALDQALALARAELSHQHIGIEREHRAVRGAAANRHELQQVLVNLLINAMQQMPQGGTLRLVTRDLGTAEVQIDVVDSGPGLGSAAQAEAVFEPFVSGRKDGTGLGLWISRGIVERYGGTLTAHARDDGRPGARFRLQLPAWPAAPRPDRAGA